MKNFCIRFVILIDSIIVMYLLRVKYIVNVVYNDGGGNFGYLNIIILILVVMRLYKKVKVY